MQPDQFVHAIRLLTETDCRRNADSGSDFKIVRTGWDNVHSDGRFEEIAPLPGAHYHELPLTKQQGIATFCRAAAMALPLQMDQRYPFAASKA
ncbi:hypothetical protein [Chitinophaga sp. YIM B06452]|uniref:hypothetical protein n=1 Tax=Chitinophaga sp. YIM B06452 TaxID=3082158 RepID=UPI0031FF281F